MTRRSPMNGKSEFRVVAAMRSCLAVVLICLLPDAGRAYAAGQAETNKPVLAIRVYGGGDAFAIAGRIGPVLTNREDWCAMDPVEIARIHRKNQIGAGIMEAEEATRVGALLKCAVVVDIASRRSDSNAWVVATDSATGARLCHVGLPGTNYAATTRAALGVLGALGKCRDMGSVTQTVRAVVIARVAAANLTAETADLPAVFEMALERALLGSSRVATFSGAWIERLVKEPPPADSRLGRLLPGCVRIEVDLVPGGTGAVSRAVASLAGSSAGPARVDVAPLGGALDPGAMAQALAGRILMTLDLPEGPLEPADYVPEVARTKALWKMLRQRHVMAEISAVEDVGFALSEHALREAPDDEKVQKAFSLFLRQRAERVEDPRQLLDLCERDIALASKWEPRMAGPGDDFDTRSNVGEFVRLFRKTMAAMDGFVWGRNGNDPRIVALREKCGEWIVRMRQSDWRYMCYLSNVDVYARDTDHLLDELDKWMTFVPPELLYMDRVGPSSREGLVLNHTIDRFTPEQRRRLYSLYQKWGTMDKPGSRAGSYAAAARLVMAYPREFDDPDAKVREQILKVAEVLAGDPSQEANFRINVMRQHWVDEEGTANQLGFPRDAVIPATRRMIESIEKKGVCVPFLYDMLDHFAPETADRPGAYMERVWEQLHRQGCRLPASWGRSPRTVESVCEIIQKRYRQRYGRDLPEFKTFVPPLVEYKEGERVVTVPRGDRFVDTELSGDAVYVLDHMYGGCDYGVYRIDTGLAPTGGAARLVGKHGAIRMLEYGESPSLSVSTNMACVATPAGAILFPFDGTAPRAITRENGLPLSKVRSCCEAQGWIYLGCSAEQEGCLARCRPDGSGMVVLTSSSRREALSELDRCAPYHVESILHDTARRRLFLTVLTEHTWTGWSYVLDLSDGRISRVFKKHNFIKQPFPLADGRYVVRVHSNTSNVCNYPGYWGYGIWDPGDFKGTPLDDFEKRVVPLAGSVHRDRWHWTGGKPHFSGFTNVVPSSTEAMFLLDDKMLLASDGRRWQAISRSDDGGYRQDLPLVDGVAPFALYQATNGVMLAVATNAVWGFGVKRLPFTVPVVTADVVVAENTNVLPATELVVRAPVGASVSVDGCVPYRFHTGVLRWAGLAEGEHRLEFKWYGRAASNSVFLSVNSSTNVTETFGEEKVERLCFDLGKGGRLRFVKVDSGQARLGPDQTARIERSFWMAEFEVTARQYAVVNPAYAAADWDLDRPVETNRESAMAFCAALGGILRDKLGGRVLRLPTGDEWCCAASSGTGRRFYCGDTREDIERDGWFPRNMAGMVGVVGRRAPSPWWIYDLLGNVGEWVLPPAERGPRTDQPIAGQFCYPERSALEGYPPAGIRLVLAEPE